MIPAELSDVLAADPEVLGGAVCFRKTRNPVRILFDHVNHGVPLEEFLEGYPSITKEQALKVLEWEKRAAIDILQTAA